MNRGVFCGGRLNFNTSTAMTEESVQVAVDPWPTWWKS
jgi:hypothetical protein